MWKINNLVKQNNFIIKKMISTLFKPISGKLDHENHILAWKPHHLLP